MKWLRSITIPFTLLLQSICLWAQPMDHCFTVGEQASYDVYYNWQFVWLQAGQVTFYTKTIQVDGQTHYHFDSQGGTLPNYDWIYPVKDRYQSYAEIESLNPQWALRDVHEGKSRLYHQQHFNYTDSFIIANLKTGDLQQSPDTLKVQHQTFDVLTAMYYCRNIDFSILKINDTVPVPVVIDNELFNLHIRFLGKELLPHRNGKTYETIKFSVLLVEGTIFSGGEDMVVWVSNDANRIPIHVEAKILVGSIKAYLKEVTGVKHSNFSY